MIKISLFTSDTLPMALRQALEEQKRDQQNLAEAYPLLKHFHELKLINSPYIKPFANAHERMDILTYTLCLLHLPHDEVIGFLKLVEPQYRDTLCELCIRTLDIGLIECCIEADIIPFEHEDLVKLTKDVVANKTVDYAIMSDDVALGILLKFQEGGKPYTTVFFDLLLDISHHYNNTNLLNKLLEFIKEQHASLGLETTLTRLESCIDRSDDYFVQFYQGLQGVEDTRDLAFYFNEIFSSDKDLERLSAVKRDFAEAFKQSLQSTIAKHN